MTKKPQKFSTIAAPSPHLVDGHAHVFTRRLPMVARRRYTPAADALPAAYDDLLAANRLTGGVLVQPSFLGTDNQYLLKVLKAARKKKNTPLLRGVCVLPPATSLPEMAEMAESGIVGVRLNLLGKRTPSLHSKRWQRFLSAVNEIDWHLEICAEGSRLPEILRDVLPCCRRVVVDHFGLPDAAAPMQCRGFRSILRTSSALLRVKISAPYRVFPDLPLDDAAVRCAELSATLRAHLGAHRLIWGSDWPWTCHEEKLTFAAALQWRQQWLDGEQDGAADLLFGSW